MWVRSLKYFQILRCDRPSPQIRTCGLYIEPCNVKREASIARAVRQAQIDYHECPYNSLIITHERLEES